MTGARLIPPAQEGAEKMRREAQLRALDEFFAVIDGNRDRLREVVDDEILRTMMQLLRAPDLKNGEAQ